MKSTARNSRDDLSVAPRQYRACRSWPDDCRRIVRQVPAPQILFRRTPARIVATVRRRSSRGPRFRPRCRAQPLTQASPYDASPSRPHKLECRSGGALPAISLESTLERIPPTGSRNAICWAARPTRQSSWSRSKTTASRRSVSATTNTASCRNRRRVLKRLIASATASAGNVGAETLAHIVSSDSAITAVRNPLPAAGGVDPETMAEIRRDAPASLSHSKTCGHRSGLCVYR